jgi:hypothetical protein
MANPSMKRIAGPLALTTTLTTNVYNNTSALIFDMIKHIHIANKTGSSAAFSLWIGATGANAAGTELFNAKPILAHDVYDWYSPGLKLLSTDFLVGGSDTATALTITINGEQYVV